MVFEDTTECRACTVVWLSEKYESFNGAFRTCSQIALNKTQLIPVINLAAKQAGQGTKSENWPHSYGVTDCRVVASVKINGVLVTL
jgi:hypothetical protein